MWTVLIHGCHHHRVIRVAQVSSWQCKTRHPSHIRLSSLEVWIRSKGPHREVHSARMLCEEQQHLNSTCLSLVPQTLLTQQCVLVHPPCRESRQISLWRCQARCRCRATLHTIPVTSVAPQGKWPVPQWCHRLHQWLMSRCPAGWKLSHSEAFAWCKRQGFKGRSCCRHRA